MMRILDASVDDVLKAIRSRDLHRDDSVEQVVSEIIADVRNRGDAALLDSGRRFDCSHLESIEQPLACRDIAPVLRHAADRIRSFHQNQASRLAAGFDAGEHGYSWSLDGVGQRILPLASVGVYVPGGKAAYPSSVLMNAIPARAAGVGKVLVSSPATAEGRLPESVVAACRVAEVDQAFRIGGAAAIAAMALGTESVPQVDKIVGPGNRFVNEAKRQLWGRVGLDGFAGPSEVAILVDGSVDPSLAAADLLTQVEHAEDNAGFLVATSREALDAVLAETAKLLAGAPREGIMSAALASEGLAIVARSLEEACEIVNSLAPEHLSIMVSEPERCLSRISNAACILLGSMTPQSAADWVLGPSHTLPTSGAARFGSPVNVLDFWKIQSVSGLRADQLRPMIPDILAMGDLEGLPMHALAAKLRLTG